MINVNKTHFLGQQKPKGDTHWTLNYKLSTFKMKIEQALSENLST